MNKTTYHFPLWFDKWSVGAVHFVVKSTGITEVVSISISSPQRGRCRRAVDTLSSL